MTTIVVHETTEAQHLVGLGWMPEELLGWIYGEDCEYRICRREYPNEHHIVDVECSDGSKLKFGLRGGRFGTHQCEVLYVHEMRN